MAKDTTNNELAKMIEDEAWSNISSRVALNEAQMEKFADKLDWPLVSSNSSIFWTESMLERFGDRIEWDSLVECIGDDCVTLDLLEKLEHKISTENFMHSNAWEKLVKRKEKELLYELAHT